MDNEEYNPHTKFYRTLLRVTEVNEEGGYFFAILPGWNVDMLVRVFLRDIPSDIRPLIEPVKRLHVYCNIGVEKIEHLRFKDWEEK